MTLILAEDLREFGDGVIYDIRVKLLQEVIWALSSPAIREESMYHGEQAFVAFLIEAGY